MDYKWLGAVLIILGCGSFGFSLAAQHKKEEAILKQLISALDYMTCELQYRMTPLPDLCRQAGQISTGITAKLFCALSRELDSQLSPDVSSSMRTTLESIQELPFSVRRNLEQLGSTLGRFDLNGQMKGLETVRANCLKDLQSLESNRDARLRSYQTLGLCTGAALAILFI